MFRGRQKSWCRRTRHFAIEMLEARQMLAGNPVLSEFMAANDSTLRDRALPPKFSDWIEIYNAGDEAVDLAGWHLTDDPDNLTNWTFPQVTLRAGGFLVVFASGNDMVDASGSFHTDFALKSTGEYLALVKPDGSTVASEFGSDGADYAQQFVDVSYGLVQEVAGDRSLVTLHDRPRYFLSPTPGAPNVPGRADLGPIVDGVTHAPNLPVEGEDIVVEAAVRAAGSPVDSVRLRYRVGFGSHTELVMSDDGVQGGDAVAGDGVYTATISTMRAAPGDMVRWYVEALDADANASRWPLFQKRSGQSPGYRQSEEYLGTVIVDPNVSSQIPIYQLFVQNAGAADTRSGTRASLFYDGEFYDNVFIRERGNSSAALSKTNHRINFNRDHRFRSVTGDDADDSGYRFRKINLQANMADPTFMRETLEAETFRRAGVPTVRAEQVRLQMNGDFFQLAGFVEHVDEDFLQRVGLDPNGALYKNPTMLNLYAVPGRGSWDSSDEKITRIDIDGPGNADLRALVTAIYEGNRDSDRATYIFDNIDLPAAINYMASFHVTQEADSMHINVMVYRDSDGTGEWRWLPFDMNFSFGQWFAADFITGNQDRHFGHPFYGAEGFEPTVRNYSFSRLQDAIISTPETREMYLRRLRTLMDEFLQPPGTPAEELYFENRINEYQAAMQQDADLDRQINGHAYGETYWTNLPPLSFNEGVQQLISDYLQQRRVHLYETHSVDNPRYDPNAPIRIDSPAGIPHAQQGTPPINFGHIVYNPVSSNQDEEYIELTNPNDVAVDISGWRLSGGVRTTFQPGTVIPSGGTLYVSPDVVAFRHRATAPTGDMRLFVQGYDGHLSNFGETITLTAAQGQVVSEVSYEGDPSAQQLSLRVTELNYHPADATAAEVALGFSENSDFEFVELQNIGPQTLDLTGVRFTDGIEFEFHSTIEGSPLLITEAGTGTTDYIEIQNVAGRPIDTSGWVVAVNDALSGNDINDVNSKLWALPSTIPTDETLFRQDVNDGMNPFWQGNIAWSTGVKGWGMIVDDKGSVVDFVVWGYTPVEIAGMATTVNGFNVTADGAWSGEIDLGEVGSTFLRGGDTDHNDASDWTFGDSESKGVVNSGLAVPFPQIRPMLDPGQFLILAKNAAAFETRYGTTALVAGEFSSGKLNNGGEAIKLEDPRNGTIQQFTYGDDWPWPEDADGDGRSLEVIDTAGNYNSPDNWRPGNEYLGSPGFAGADSLKDVAINEVVSRSIEPEVDWIELYNATDTAIDVGGWYLSDTSDDLKKYQIPADTTIPAGGYVVFDESQFNPPPHSTDFALNASHGDDVWLLEADAEGNLIRFVDHVDFGASAAGESLGRYLDGSGMLYPTIVPTPESANSRPRLGTVIISEVMYHPVDPGVGVDADDFEFVEIHNTAAEAIPLSDWRLDGGIEFAFPEQIELAGGETLVVVPFDPSDATMAAAFRQEHGMDETGTLTGPYRGKLSNGGDRVQLLRPGLPPEDEPEFIPGLLEDELIYDDAAPWPTEADGGGRSLSRRSAVLWGNSDTSWTATEASPGQVALYLHPGDANLDDVTDVRDFMIWNTNKFTSGTTWEQGDFNGDAVTDVRDFMIWNANKFTSTPAPVPVPTQAVDDVFGTDATLLAELVWLSELLDSDSASAQDDDEKSDETIDKVLASYW